MKLKSVKACFFNLDSTTHS